MKPPCRKVLLAFIASALVISGSTQAWATSPAGSSPSVPSTIPVSGTLVVVPNEARPAGTRGGSGPGSNDDAHGTTVSLATRDGHWIRLTGAAVRGAKTGASFRGRLAVPQAVRSRVQRGAAAAPTTTTILAGADKLGQPMAVASATISDATARSAAPMAHTLDVMYLREVADFAPHTSDIQTALDRLNSYWTSQSGGQITSLTRTRAIEVQIAPGTLNICDPGATWNHAATTFAGSDLSVYTNGSGRHLLVIVPGSRCGVGYGYGSVGPNIHRGGVTWSSVPEWDQTLWDQVIFHEIGHNLSLWHSAARTCTSGAVDAPLVNNVVAAPCADTTYRDFYDVMGGGFLVGDPNGGLLTSNLANVAALNSTHRAALDTLPTGSGGILPVTAAGGSTRTLTIAPAASTSGLRALQITDPDTAEKLYVEYRYPTGRDANSMYASYLAKTGSDTFAPGVRLLRAIPMGGGGSSTSTALSRVDDTGRARMWWPAGSSFTSHTGQVRVDVNSTGAAGASVTVTFAPLPPFDAIPTPRIVGTATVGATLTAQDAAPGSWRPTADTVTYRWLRDGAPISGATAQSYVVSWRDADKTLTVRATGSKTGYASASAVSEEIEVAPVQFSAVPTPVISGPPVVGSMLIARRASRSFWTPSARSVRYQWLRDNVAIPGATSEHHMAESADVGANLTVRVSGWRPGYATTSSTSAGVRVEPAPPRVTASVRRVFGPTRYETSARAAAEGFPSGTSAPVVYLASGRSWHGSVAATAAAEYEGAALLLVPPSGTVRREVLARVTALAPHRIVTVGDTDVIAESVVEQVRTARPSAAFTRIAVNNGYEASRALTTHAFPAGKGGTVWVVDGRHYGEATVTAGAAGTRGEPVILVDGSKNSLDSPTLAAIARLQPTRVHVVGRTWRVSAGIENQLSATTPTTRIEGPNQYETSVKVNALVYPGSTMTRGYLVSGQNWTEATTIGVSAAQVEAPVFLTPQNCVPRSVLATLGEKGATEVVVVGGSRSIATRAAWLRPCR